MKRVFLIKKGVFVLLLALFAGMGTAYAYNFSATCPTGQTLYFNITDATNHYVEITYPRYYSDDKYFSYWYGYTEPTGNITLPSSVTYNGTNYSVTAIGNYAFFGCSGLTGSLTFPNTITTIGVNAFTSCSGFTGSLTLTNHVTGIGANAFDGCNFTGSLVIPNSMTSIGYYAFNGCGGFTSLIIPASVSAINDMAFAYCTGLTSMTVLPTAPPTISENLYGRPFLGVPTDIPVYVPCGSLAAYQSALGWSRFTNILC